MPSIRTRVPGAAFAANAATAARVAVAGATATADLYSVF
tara:strand:- start:1559 stop:1675 length:117 start_codon:yes stop_codon:yes gene_type:complete